MRLYLYLFIPVLSVVSGQELTCGTNEVLNSCPAYCSYENTCGTMFGGIVYDCPQLDTDYVCTPRCDCDANFVRVDGNCVAPESCPVDSTCIGLNEIFNGCGSCDGTCNNPNPICAAVCTPGCYCNTGYVRDETGTCIEKAACPVVNITCGTNEELVMCPQYCTFDKDCPSEYGGLVRSCAAPPPFYQCKPRCYCAPGFLRIDGICQTPDMCPNSTCRRQNEVFTTCGSCDGSCSNLNPICALYCRIGCYCAPGYVRDDVGDCIDPGSCPNTTVCPGENEEFSTCGYCDRTCDVPDPICPKMCRIGCFCKSGYVKNANGVCILLADCPPKTTCPGPNEVYTTCGSCDGTCDNPNPICTAVCRTGCFCEAGYVRNSSGTCILQAECNKVKPTKRRKNRRRRKSRRHHKPRRHSKRKHRRPKYYEPTYISRFL